MMSPRRLKTLALFSVFSVGTVLAFQNCSNGGGLSLEGGTSRLSSNSSSNKILLGSCPQLASGGALQVCEERFAKNLDSQRDFADGCGTNYVVALCPVTPELLGTCKSVESGFDRNLSYFEGFTSSTMTAQQEAVQAEQSCVNGTWSGPGP